MTEDIWMEFARSRGEMPFSVGFVQQRRLQPEKYSNISTQIMQEKIGYVSENRVLYNMSEMNAFAVAIDEYACHTAFR